MIKLDIGCGRSKVGGDFIGVDPYVQTDVSATMWELPYGDNVADFIYSSHALEHVSKWQAQAALREWYRVLKPDCRADIRVPDLEWCCRSWLEHQTNDWWMDIIFGNQEHDGEYHRTGFTRKLMTDYLSQAGFDVESFEIIDSHGQPTMKFIVRKP